MNLSVVYGRDVDGETTTFGTSGYTFKNTFVIYDRKTESLWYPLDDKAFTAISGKYSGKKLPFLKSSAVMTLGEWRNKHPETKVLLGDRTRIKPTGVTKQPAAETDKR